MVFSLLRLEPDIVSRKENGNGMFWPLIGIFESKLIAIWELSPRNCLPRALISFRSGV